MIQRNGHRVVPVLAALGLLAVLVFVVGAAVAADGQAGCPMMSKGTQGTQAAGCPMMSKGTQGTQAAACPMHAGATAQNACSVCSYAKGTAECIEADEAAKKVQAVGATFVTASALSQKITSGQPPIIINVLAADSYNASHIKGSINIPYTEVEALAPKVLPDKSAEIVVYCAGYKCGASIQAATALKKLGYTNVGDYKGGIKEWSDLGKPVEGTKKAEGKGA